MLSRSYLPQESRKDLLAYSPMLHARLFNCTEKYRNEHFQATRSSLAAKEAPDQSPWLDGNPDIDRPLFVQFCANKPDELLGAAEYVAPYVDAVDLNLGCPQGIARSGHYGAFLQEDRDTIYKLINRLHKDLSIPVTAKMRILETPEKTLDYAKMILSAGASILTVHGRRREQKGHNTGLADWNMLRYLRDNLPPETVLFANGNVLNHGDLKRCLEATGFDGVMSAEANLNDPTVFAEPPTDVNDREYWRGADGIGGYRIDGVVRRYFDIIYRHVLDQTPPTRPPLYLPGDDVSETAITEPPIESQDQQKKSKKGKREKGSIMSPNLKVMQGHLFGMLRAVVGTHTDIRDALARSRYGEMHNFERVLQMLEKAVRVALDEEAAIITTGGNAESSEVLQVEVVSETEKVLAPYRRPWWVCQPFIRPSPEEALAKGALKAKKRDIAQEDADTQAQDGSKRQKLAEPVHREDKPEVVDKVNNAPAAAVVCG
jgi:tRNA-dihydrouridine synthase 1